MSSSGITLAVDLPAPPERVFEVFADPALRPQWQSSLKRVELLDDPEPHLGQRWIDVTVVGVRPRMETTVFEPFRRWGERGTWHSVSADLVLHFVATAQGTRVEATVDVRGSGVGRLAAAVARRAAPAALASDLRRVSTLL